MRISVIVPVLNEAGLIGTNLAALRPFRSKGHELIVVDGGSSDGTATMARPLADQVLESPRGRALQMNAGARVARGDVLLFLHADTLLPPDAAEILERIFAAGAAWARFDLRLSGDRLPFRIIAMLVNARSRLTGIATGDQCISVRKDLFLQVGGFPEIPLMEDVALCRRLKEQGGYPECLREKAKTSSRRWEEYGIARTILLMWKLRIAYFFGADPAKLAILYHRAPTRRPG